MVDLDSTSPLTETSLLQPLPLHLAGRLLYLGCASGPPPDAHAIVQFPSYPGRGPLVLTHMLKPRKPVPLPYSAESKYWTMCACDTTAAEPWGLPWNIELSRQLHEKSNANANNAVRLSRPADTVSTVYGI